MDTQTETVTSKSTKKAAPAPKKEAKVAAPVKKEVAKKETAKSQGRERSFPLNAKIKLVAKENPHRTGTNLHKQFSKYKNGMTVQQALDAGVVWANLHYLSKLGHIKVG